MISWRRISLKGHILFAISITTFATACARHRHADSLPQIQKTADACGFRMGEVTVASGYGVQDNFHVPAFEAFRAGSQQFSVRHIHASETDARKYFWEKGRNAADTDCQHGVDVPTLLYFVSHATLQKIYVLSKEFVTTKSMRLGNGTLRYYWQCACQSFAHGPLVDHDYRFPGRFSGSIQNYSTEESANLFDQESRWGRSLQGGLRMACGVSTNMDCSKDESLALWFYKEKFGFDVADSFIMGIHRPGYIPLCVTAGDSPHPTQTPLFDLDFDTRRYPEQCDDENCPIDYYHLEYLEEFCSDCGDEIDIRGFDISSFPAFTFSLEGEAIECPPSIPPALGVSAGTGIVVCGELGVRWIEQDEDGVIFYRDETAEIELGPPIYNEYFYTEKAISFLEKMGWTGDDVDEPSGVRLMIDVYPVTSPDQNERTRWLKGVVFRFKRILGVHSKDGRVLEARELGLPGSMVVQLNRKAEVVRASRDWKKLEDELPSFETRRSLEVATEEAIALIGGVEAYDNGYGEPVLVTAGYREARSKDEDQTRLRPVYVFRFEPLNPSLSSEYPPRQVEIFAERGFEPYDPYDSEEAAKQ